MPTEMPPRLLPCFSLLAAALFVIGARGVSGQEAAAETTPTAKEGDAGLLLVSKASLPKVYAPVTGARETVLAPAYVGKYSIRLYSLEKWQADGLAWEGFQAAAIKRADALVDTLEPEFKRDPRGVLDYAVLRHESPWLSSVLLSRRFLPRFEREFGERLYVIVLDRHQLYVFPADGGKLDAYAPALADLYHDESVIRHPVSLEIFLVDDSGIRVIGSIED